MTFDTNNSITGTYSQQISNTRPSLTGKDKFTMETSQNSEFGGHDVALPKGTIDESTVSSPISRSVTPFSTPSTAIVIRSPQTDVGRENGLTTSPISSACALQIPPLPLADIDGHRSISPSPRRIVHSTIQTLVHSSEDGKSYQVEHLSETVFMSPASDEEHMFSSPPIIPSELTTLSLSPRRLSPTPISEMTRITSPVTRITSPVTRIISPLIWENCAHQAIQSSTDSATSSNLQEFHLQHVSIPIPEHVEENPAPGHAEAEGARQAPSFFEALRAQIRKIIIGGIVLILAGFVTGMATYLGDRYGTQSD